MWKELFSLCNFKGRISRQGYLFWGLTLFLFKYLIDWLVASMVFDRAWTPLQYLIWPDGQSLSILQLPAEDARFAITMLALALPFILLGVMLTLQRLNDADMSKLLIVLFFVPMVNLLFILWLCLLPGLYTQSINQPVELRRRRDPAPPAIGNNSAFWLSAFVSSVMTAVLIVFATVVLKSYGFGVFVLLPFANGWLAAILYTYPAPRTFEQCLCVGLASLGVTWLIVLLFAIEGFFCLLMVAPLAAGLGIMGVAAGYAFQWRHWVEHNTPALVLSLILVIPALMAAEASTVPGPPNYIARTEVIINAPAAIVWKYVVSFPPLPEPEEWLFRLGIAYPQHAEIVGQGVGAVRYCVFSTGPFVEPITVWDEPNRLAFDVTQQPCPMTELSPFHIHPPHLDNFLVSRRGEFLLEALPDGTTKLIGTTWYTNKMWPSSYWGMWSDHLISKIHRRVLDHVKRCAEQDTSSLHK